MEPRLNPGIKARLAHLSAYPAPPRNGEWQSAQLRRRMPVHAHQRDHASNRKAGADRLRKPRRAEILGRDAVNAVDGLRPPARPRTRGGPALQ